jgi:hypothetical protein
MSRHATASGANVHSPYRQAFADEAARLADATVYTGADINKIALQLDNGTQWRISSIDGSGIATWTLLTVHGVLQKLAPFTIEDTDLVAAALTQTFAAFATLPADAFLRGFTFDIVAGFTGLTNPVAAVDGAVSGGSLAAGVPIDGALAKAHAPGTGQDNLLVDNEALDITISADNNVDNASAGELIVTVYYQSLVGALE